MSQDTDPDDRDADDRDEVRWHDVTPAGQPEDLGPSVERIIRNIPRF